MGKNEGAGERASKGEIFSPAPLLPCSLARVLILGLGNPLLGDDGVGWRVVEQLESDIANYAMRNTQYEFDCHAGGGLSLMERLIGYDRAILIDALESRQDEIGAVRCWGLEELTNPGAGHLASSHDTTLQNAMDAARALNVKLPRDICVVTLESPRVYDFAEELSPAVAAAVPRAVQKVEQVLSAWTSRMPRRKTQLDRIANQLMA